MARALNRLSALEVRGAKRPSLLADGGNLYLQISDSGAKSWLFRFMRQGQSRAMGLGSLNAVGLAKAREKAAKCREQLADGIDPIEARKIDKAKRTASDRNTITFKDAADAYIAAHDAGWKNEKHAVQWRNTLKTYAHPELGKFAVSVIDTSMVLRVLEPIWVTKTVTAGRLRGRIERVLDWAGAKGYRTGDNPARWRGHLDNLLPAQNRVHEVRHQRSLPYAEIADFLVRLRSQPGIAARALELNILTVSRTKEIDLATWDEIDFAQEVWNRPGEHMKNGTDHRQPLSQRAVEILIEARKIATGDFIFPGQKPGKPLSDMAMISVLRRMGVDAVTHGFRATFRTWAEEKTGHPLAVLEQAMAHTISDKLVAAYQRGDLFEKRRRLMNTWAAYCAKERPADNVVAINAGT